MRIRMTLGGIMEKYYTLNDLAKFTGLTTRTLRNYLKMDVLSGEKIDGVWMFTVEELEAFLVNPVVKPSIQAKQNALVYDFMLDEKKKTNEICTIQDYYAEGDEGKEIAEFFCKAVNESGADVRFSMEKAGNYVRVILKGAEDAVMDILDAYYRRGWERHTEDIGKYISE